MELKLNEITYIGKLYKDITDISLFKHIKYEVKGNEEGNLEKLGVMKNGKLTEPLNQLFDIVAKANQVSRLIIKMPDVVMEKSVYSKEGVKVLIENKGGEVSLSLLENELDRIRFEISEHLGMSVQQHSVFSTELPLMEMVFLLAVIDWVRKQSLLSYINEHSIEPLTLTALIKYLEKPMNNGIMGLIKNTFELNAFQLTEKLMENYLKNFSDSRLISLQEGEIALNSELLKFALNFTVIDAQVVLETFQMNQEGNVLNSGIIALTSGVKDIVAFTYTEKAIEMQIISSATLISWIETYFDCPELR